MDDLRLVLSVAWQFLRMPFVIWGYSFSFAEIMVFGVVIGWLIWLWVNFVLD